MTILKQYLKLMLTGILFLPLTSFSIPDQPHPGFDMTSITLQRTGSAFEPLVMGIEFFSDGRFVIVTSDDLTRGGSWEQNPGNNSEVFIVNDINANNPVALEIGDGFTGLSGVVIVNDKLYVSDRDGFYELVLNGQGTSITARNKIVTWPGGPTWHQWGFTPMHHNGKFYAPWSGTIVPGGPSTTDANHAMSGSFLEWDLQGNLSTFASGLRSPNGSGINPTNGEVMVCDNQGSWLPSSTCAIMVKDKFNGHRHETRTTIDNWDYYPPTAWLPHGPVSRSPSQPIYVTHGIYEGQWIFGDINHEGLMRMNVETIEGLSNGAVFPFSRGMNEGNNSAAVNRLVWGPDSALYIGTDGRIAGNWSNAGTRFPIYKMMEKATPEFEILAVRSFQEGMEIEFTKPVNESQVNSWNYTARQWTYQRQLNYGQGKQGDENRTVSATTVSANGKRVLLTINGLKDQANSNVTDADGHSEGYVTYLQLTGVQSATGENLWNNEVWYTMNAKSDVPWDPNEPVVSDFGRDMKKLNPIALQRHLNRMSIDIEKSGEYVVVLRAMDGQVLKSKSFQGGEIQYFESPKSQPGLYIVQIQKAGDSYFQKVIF